MSKPEEYKCPLTMDKKGEFQNCMGKECAWFSTIRGQDPQTGQEIDNTGCAVAWLPMLMINNAKEVRQMAAATEGARNRMAEVGHMVGKNTEQVGGLVNGMAKAMQSAETLRAAQTLQSNPNPAPSPVLTQPAPE